MWVWLPKTFFPHMFHSGFCMTYHMLGIIWLLRYLTFIQNCKINCISTQIYSIWTHISHFRWILVECLLEAFNGSLLYNSWTLICILLDYRMKTLSGLCCLLNSIFPDFFLLHLDVGRHSRWKEYLFIFDCKFIKNFSALYIFALKLTCNFVLITIFYCLLYMLFFYCKVLWF